MVPPHITNDSVFVLDMVILYVFAIRFKWCAIVCKSSSEVAIKSVLLYRVSYSLISCYCIYIYIYSYAHNNITINSNF